MKKLICFIMSKAEYDQLWKVKYKPERACSINRSMVKMYLQKVYCTALCMGMVRNMFCLVFSMNWFLLFFLVTLWRGLLQLTGSVPLFFWNLTLSLCFLGSQGKVDPRFHLRQVPSSLRLQGNGGQLGGELPNSNDVLNSGVSRWALTRLGFTPPALGPSASSWAGQHKSQLLGPLEPVLSILAWKQGQRTGKWAKRKS